MFDSDWWSQIRTFPVSRNSISRNQFLERSTCENTDLFFDLDIQEFEKLSSLRSQFTKTTKSNSSKNLSLVEFSAPSGISRPVVETVI